MATDATWKPSVEKIRETQKSIKLECRSNRSVCIGRGFKQIFFISAIRTYANRSARLQQVLNCGREENNRVDKRTMT